MTITITEARRFLLHHQNLLRPGTLSGTEGILAWLRKTRALQFDPINIVGRSHDLTLHSRVAGYRSGMLEDLLYRDRLLVEHFDKEFCVYPVEDWPYLHHRRQGFLDWARGREREGRMFAHHEEVLSEIRSRGPLSSRELSLEGQVDWFWGPKANLSRAVLDHLFYGGLVSIHSRTNNRKNYDLAERIVPPETRALCGSVPAGETLTEWYVRRRIGSVGLLWNRSGSAWLGLGKTPERQKAIDSLTDKKELCPLSVEGIKQPFYARTADWKGFTEFTIPDPDPENGTFIAPLDNLLWDREMIRQLFGFDYVWEIYKPPAQRKWGYYVLPLLAGDRIIGRAEPVFDRTSGKLELKNLWHEEGIKWGKTEKAALRQAVERLNQFLQ
jgi:uncharacterized protein YcaQ